MRCNAAWYELNISAPDNEVSACCYYGGAKDEWTDAPRSLDDYWNGANMQEVRKVNVVEQSPSGCSNCHFFHGRGPTQQYFEPLLSGPPAGLSDRQTRNWELAAQAFRDGRTTVESRPLRYYVNFGFMCNLSCIQCHQVPRRKQNRRQVSSDVLFKWREDFRSALDVGVIGGEPFLLPEALQFIRAFVEDPALADVRLSIYTNGTLHHKHMATLAKKKKLSLAVSLDSMEDAYEFIRVDGDWAVVERNILDFVRYGKEHGLDWTLSTTCGLMKRGIAKLPKFASWCVSNNIPTFFYEIISARGVERAAAEQNFVANPEVLSDIPDWERCFQEAADIFEAGGMPNPAGSLRFFRDLVATKLRSAPTLPPSVAKANDWVLFLNEGANEFLDDFHSHIHSPGVEGPFIFVEEGEARFKTTELRDHIATDFWELPHRPDGDLWVKFVCEWPHDTPESERCLIHLQDQSWLMQWPSDFVQTQAKGTLVLRYVKVPPTSQRIRVLIYGNDDSASVGILPTRMTLELRNSVSPQPVSAHA